MQPWALCDHYELPSRESIWQAGKAHTYLIRSNTEHYCCFKSNLGKSNLKDKKSLREIGQKIRERESKNMISLSLEKRIEQNEGQKNILGKCFSSNNLHLSEVPQISKTSFNPQNRVLNPVQNEYGLVQKHAYLPEKIIINKAHITRNIPNPESDCFRAPIKMKKIVNISQSENLVYENNKIGLDRESGKAENRQLIRSRSLQFTFKPENTQNELKLTQRLDDCRKAESFANESEFEDEFSVALSQNFGTFGMSSRFEELQMTESIMKEPSTPETVSSQKIIFGY